LSSYILRLRIPKRFPESRRLALSTTPDIDSLRVHCLTHSYQLSQNARRRKQIHQETQSFATLLREKDRTLTDKEKSLKFDLDVNLINQQCRAEELRWERNWTTIRNEWIIETLRTTLHPKPPIDFLSQSYQDAFANKIPPTNKRPATLVHVSSTISETNIANLIALDKELTNEIAHLEATVPPTATAPPRKSSLKKSLPPTPLTTPSPSPDKSRTSNAYNLRFTRSSSRLSTRSSTEFPHQPTSTRKMSSDHCTMLHYSHG